MTSAFKSSLSVAPGRSARAAQPSVKPLDGDQVLSKIGDYFDKWDLDGKGTLSWSEIRDCVASPSIEGEEAVTLATLRSLLEHDAEFRGKSRPSAVSLDRIYDISFEYDTDDTDEEFGRPVIEAMYQKFASKTVPLKTELFSDGLPNADSIRQGVSPSCGFLSATYAQVSSNPQSIVTAIQPGKDGAILVKFPGFVKTIEVSPLTPTERLLSASSGENGAWLGTLEKAWGVHLSKGRPEAAFEMTTYPEEAIRAWTNRPAHTVDFSPKTTSKAFSKLVADADQALQEGGAVVAWTKHEGFSEKDFVSGHAYTVTGIDRESGTVSLRNPWGRLEPVDKNGDAKDGVDDGKFSLSLKEFRDNFKSLAQSTL